MFKPRLSPELRLCSQLRPIYLLLIFIVGICHDHRGLGPPSSFALHMLRDHQLHRFLKKCVGNVRNLFQTGFD
jgi:hypothetical protein